MGSPPTEFGRGVYTEDLTQVTLTRPFLLGQVEVTQEQWVVMGMPNKAGTIDDGIGGTDCVEAHCPASTMSWCEANEYVNRLSRAEGREECVTLDNPRGTFGVDFTCDGATSRGPTYYECSGYRLPTAGEWEYAARAGTTTAFSSGPWTVEDQNCVSMDHLDAAAWYCANSGGHTHPVCTREPNAWGLYDMMGNAAEMVADTGQYGYGPGPLTDPPLAPARQDNMRDFRLTRGSFYFGNPMALRIADQSFPVPLSGRGARVVALGLRVARTLSADEAAEWRAR